jgi:hypothetical protein
MKDQLKILVAAVLFLSATVAFSQVEVATSLENQTIQLTPDTCMVYSSFKATINTGKAYLAWTAKHLREDGLFIIYRSEDGVNFENIGSKAGVGVPVPTAIAYYFTDPSPTVEKMHYKLLFISKSNTFVMSDKITAVNTSQTAAKRTP